MINISGESLFLFFFLIPLHFIFSPSQLIIYSKSLMHKKNNLLILREAFFINELFFLMISFSIQKKIELIFSM